MKKTWFSLTGLSLVLLTGCVSRPISSSGYVAPSSWYRPDNQYRGELSEFDILNTESVGSSAGVAGNFKEPTIQKGQKLLLIQSGAMVPDNEMMVAAGSAFLVAPFSGIPLGDKIDMAKSLRNVAARGGYTHVLCYWGVLESAQVDKEGKVFSWVPIAGRFIPDQQEKMRIRLKAILIDLLTQNWKMVTPEVQSDIHYSSDSSREEQDQKLVMELKARGYKSLIAELLKEQ